MRRRISGLTPLLLFIASNNLDKFFVSQTIVVLLQRQKDSKRTHKLVTMMIIISIIVKIT